MKFLMVILLLVGAFLGGYHMGHQPGSPDVVTMTKERCQQLAELGGKVASSLASDIKSQGQQQQPSAAVVPDEYIKIAGQVYRLSSPQPVHEVPR